MTQRSDLREDVKTDWSWADKHMKQIIALLKDNAHRLLSVQMASPEEDMKQATDLVIEVVGGRILVRIRRPYFKYRDLTIRSWRQNGAKTELAKIQEGFGDWYLYVWTGDAEKFTDWMLVDMATLRESGLLEDRKITYNHDGLTGFIAISSVELYMDGCLAGFDEQGVISRSVL